MLKRTALLPPLLAITVAALAATGCVVDGCVHGNGAGCSDGIYSVDMAPPGGAQCPTGCVPACGGSDQCITPAAITQDHAFCATACKDDRDCGAGARCITLFAALQPSSCIPDTLKIGCTDQSDAICDTQATCDGDVAVERFADNARGICGWERVHCANGCTAGACNP